MSLSLSNDGACAKAVDVVECCLGAPASSAQPAGTKLGPPAYPVGDDDARGEWFRLPGVAWKTGIRVKAIVAHVTLNAPPSLWVIGLVPHYPYKNFMTV